MKTIGFDIKKHEIITIDGRKNVERRVNYYYTCMVLKSIGLLSTLQQYT